MMAHAFRRCCCPFWVYGISDSFRRKFLIYKPMPILDSEKYHRSLGLIGANSSRRTRSRRLIERNDLYFNFLPTACELIDLLAPNRKMKSVMRYDNEYHHHILRHLDLMTQWKHKSGKLFSLFRSHRDMYAEFRRYRTVVQRALWHEFLFFLTMR
jgi:hypothetical protein